MRRFGDRTPSTTATWTLDADAHNLMPGTHLTEGQIAVLRLSPLLRHPDDPS